MLLPSSKHLLKTLLASLLLVFLADGVSAQTGSDACHVYVVDVAKSARALKLAERAENEREAAKALATGQTIFPEFRPAIGEEELTTKHYPFPGSKLIITASVFYTDESMASHGQAESDSHNDSILVGVIVSDKAKPNALAQLAGNVAAEATYDEHTNKLRAKQYVKVRGRMYLVGIECDCMTEKKPK